MGVVGDVVGDRGRLPFRRRVGRERNIEELGMAADGDGHAGLAIAPDRSAALVRDRSVVLDQAFERFPGQIEPVELGVAALEPSDHAQSLDVVIEPAVGRKAGVERGLAGMPERRMAKVVSECQGLREVFVEPERTRQRARDLRHFQRVGQAGAIVIALVRDKDLGLVLEPTECGRVNDAVAVAPEDVATRALRFRVQTPAARPRITGIGRTFATGFDRHGSAPCGIDPAPGRT